jgi:stage II sporulation protein D
MFSCNISAGAQKFTAAILIALLISVPAASAGAVEFDAGPLLEQTRLYLDEGQFLECIDAYYQVYQFSRKPKERALGLVRIADIQALFLDHKEEALSLYLKARKEFTSKDIPENAFFNAGMIEYESGRLEQARKSLGSFIKLYPQSFRASTAEYLLQRIEADLADSTHRAEKETTPSEDNLVPGEAPLVRVALNQSERVSLRFPSELEVRTAEGIQKWPAGEYGFANVNQKLQVEDQVLGNQLTLIPVKGSFIWQGRPYKGNAVVKIVKNQVLLINQLSLETYLEGVVPKEMLPSWKLEALKAQAVCARSYAYYLLRKSEDKDYDVAATTASQVYGGANVGNDTTNRAVSATRGTILAYNGTPVLTYFHSHSGGVLEDASQVWSGSSLLYYQVKNDDISEKYSPLSWQYVVKNEDLVRTLQKNGFRVQQVTDLTAGEVSPSGRLATVAITTDSGPLTIRANSLRMWLGATNMKSVLVTITKQEEGYLFEGHGFGHGVGMSQWGAQGMAQGGASYEQILRHYYPGTELKMIYR